MGAILKDIDGVREEATMNLSSIGLVLPVFLLLSVLTVGGVEVRAAEETAGAPVVSSREMPLLRGDTWVKMSQDEKTAFVWGMGHVITMERDRMESHPELKKESFAVKMASGLAGMPMSEVVSAVDRFYAEKPDRTSEPVVKVMWMVIVKPKAMGDNDQK
jgi:hypothetical protein